VTAGITILVIIYLGLSFFIFYGAVYLHQYLRDHGIFFEFGHADEVLVEFFLLWIILAIINLIVIAITRSYKAKSKMSI